MSEHPGTVFSSDRISGGVKWVARPVTAGGRRGLALGGRGGRALVFEGEGDSVAEAEADGEVGFSRLRSRSRPPMPVT
jgi:hypothetical protein